MNIDSIEKIIDGFDIRYNEKHLQEVFDSLPIKERFTFDFILLKITVAQENNMPLFEFDKLSIEQQELLFAYHFAKGRMKAIDEFYTNNTKTNHHFTLLDRLKKFIKGLGL